MRHFFLSVVFYIGFVSSALALECKQDTLTENSDGEMLQTLSGDIFEIAWRRQHNCTPLVADE